MNNTAQYFAAANGRYGFVSYFGEIFGSLDRLYILKGGPGTGKSTLMRRIGADAEREGYRVEYILCSSDPSSLDGVVIPSCSLGIVDGTAPHTLDPKYPAARETLVDLSRFWDDDALYEKRHNIIALSGEISSLWRSAYGYLGAAGTLGDIARDLTEPYILRDKLDGAVRRMLRSARHGDGYSLTTRLTSAFGADVRLDTFTGAADKIYCLDDRCEIADIVLRRIADEARTLSQRTVASYSPLDTAKLDALLLPDCSVAFVPSDDVYNKEAKILNTSRFVDDNGLRSVKARLRQCRRLRAEALSCAANAVGKARELHSELEKYYIAAMDFKAVSTFTSELSHKLFD